MIGVIYKISSTVKPDHFYIGSTKNYKLRMWQHRRTLELGKHKNKQIQNHVNKYGLADLTFEIIDSLTVGNILTMEQFYIDQLKPKFNQTPTAGSNAGFKQSESFKNLISSIHKGKVVSDETRKKMSDAARGRKRSEESKLKQGEKLKGRKRPPFSEEWKANLSKAQKGHTNNIKGWETRRNKLKAAA